MSWTVCQVKKVRLHCIFPQHFPSPPPPPKKQNYIWAASVTSAPLSAPSHVAPPTLICAQRKAPLQHQHYTRQQRANNSEREKERERKWLTRHKLPSSETSRKSRLWSSRADPIPDLRQLGVLAGGGGGGARTDAGDARVKLLKLLNSVQSGAGCVFSLHLASRCWWGLVKS